MFNFANTDTIVALSTPSGVGAIGVVRVSGPDAFAIVQPIFFGKDLCNQLSHTAHFGLIKDGLVVIDEVVVTLFRGPNSYTREDTVEISCHGSVFIINRIIRLLIANGCRYALAGEFTQRAYLNGRFDLAQAEAVADLISADSASSHFAAMNQMRGGFSTAIKNLREKLLNFASLIELELDFAEEDVEFANRNDLKQVVYDLIVEISPLVSSFELGNVLKSGIPIVIIGKPNAGKSTLLNALLNEERAIVSDIAGTTRDVIEDELIISGVKFRLIDTAGLRETSDRLEAIGISRTKVKIQESSLIIYLFDASSESLEEDFIEIEALKQQSIDVLLVANKIDLLKGMTNDAVRVLLQKSQFSSVSVSAEQKVGIEELKSKVLEMSKLPDFKSGDTIVTNIRHIDSLRSTQTALEAVLDGLEHGVTGDFLALDIRQSLHYLGQITGEVTNDELLGNIFGKFCIGK